MGASYCSFVYFLVKQQKRQGRSSVNREVPDVVGYCMSVEGSAVFFMLGSRHIVASRVTYKYVINTGEGQIV